MSATADSADTNGASGTYSLGRRNTELLRIATAGSVDDGKSTLIGRLLYDSKAILADQMEHVVQTSERRGDGYVNLALLTDGLRAEREQGITIDVAYRYFADAAPQVHHRRHARPRAVHAEHGDGRIDRRASDHHPRRRAPRASSEQSAATRATSRRSCASRTSSCRGQQDGPRQAGTRRGLLRRSLSSRFRDLGGAARRSRTSRSSR